jgi:hypothetical protein
MAVAKTMPRYTTGSDRQVQWAAAASPTIPAGRAGAADHRKATDNRGERRSADRAGQHPVPECSPRSSDHLAPKVGSAEARQQMGSNQCP